MFGSNNASNSQALALYLLHQAVEAFAKSPVRLVEWKLKTVNSETNRERDCVFKTLEIKGFFNFTSNGVFETGCWFTFILHLVMDGRKGHNNAMNFLVGQCGSTVVFCTATQPLLHAVDAKKGGCKAAYGFTDDE